MSLGVFIARSCVALPSLFAAQNPLRRQLCKSLNLRDRGTSVRPARKQMYLGIAQLLDLDPRRGGF